MSWSRFGIFVNQYISGGDVTPEHFPPEPPEDIRSVDEYRFDRNIQGLEALKLLAEAGLEIARPRATDRYLSEHPEAQERSSLIGAGVSRQPSGRTLLVQFTRHGRSRGAVYTINARDLIFEGVTLLVSPKEA
jgi:hypothetical protein